MKGSISDLAKLVVGGALVAADMLVSGAGEKVKENALDDERRRRGLAAVQQGASLSGVTALRR
jgi:hypothetical protein